MHLLRPHISDLPERRRPDLRPRVLANFPRHRWPDALLGHLTSATARQANQDASQHINLQWWVPIKNNSTLCKCHVRYDSGGSRISQTYYLAKFLPKTAWKWRKSCHCMISQQFAKYNLRFYRVKFRAVFGNTSSRVSVGFLFWTDCWATLTLSVRLTSSYWERTRIYAREN